MSALTTVCSWLYRHKDTKCQRSRLCVRDLKDSLADTKAAALMAVFLRPWNVDFQQARPSADWNTAVSSFSVLFFFFFSPVLSIQPVMLLCLGTSVNSKVKEKEHETVNSCCCCCFFLLFFFGGVVLGFGFCFYQGEHNRGGTSSLSSPLLYCKDLNYHLRWCLPMWLRSASWR